MKAVVRGYTAQPVFLLKGNVQMQGYEHMKKRTFITREEMLKPGLFTFSTGDMGTCEMAGRNAYDAMDKLKDGFREQSLDLRGRTRCWCLENVEPIH